MYKINERFNSETITIEQYRGTLASATTIVNALLPLGIPTAISVDAAGKVILTVSGGEISRGTSFVFSGAEYLQGNSTLIKKLFNFVPEENKNTQLPEQAQPQEGIVSKLRTRFEAEQPSAPTVQKKKWVEISSQEAAELAEELDNQISSIAYNYVIENEDCDRDDDGDDEEFYTDNNEDDIIAPEVVPNGNRILVTLRSHHTSLVKEALKRMLGFLAERKLVGGICEKDASDNSSAVVEVSFKKLA